MITLTFDGLYRPLHAANATHDHSGLMCYGWVVRRDGREVAHGHGAYARPQDASSNSAEYLALIEGLEALRDMHLEAETVEVIGDARSVIDQMMGRANVSSAQARPLYQRAARIARHFRRLIWSWRPRKHNHAADRLTRRALQQVRESHALEEMPKPHRRGLISLLNFTVFGAA